MLFDLRGRGRRRTVQVIYLSLALLMGGGLVLFGIGGAGGGGLLDAFQNESQSTSDIVQQRLDDAETRVRNNPQSEAALAALTRARFQAAEFDQNTATFTEDGKAQLRSATAAYDRYLKVAGDKADPNIANLMVQAYTALEQPQKAFQAMDVVVSNRPPTANLYVQLAAYAYAAGNTRQGELAGDRAIELAPKDDKEQVRAQVEGLKSQAEAQATTTAPAATG
jgi:ElaB/YqjD/DUF883 family membrane-anchored ribosome-binding protein